MTRNPAQAAAPVFDFSIGNEVLGLFHRPSVAAQPRNEPTTGNLTGSNQLLPATRAPGPNMSLADFCTTYDLSADIFTKFSDQKYTNASLLHFATVPELTEIKFELGEIAALRDAIIIANGCK